MPNGFKLSTMGVLAAMLMAGTASAATINLGGNGGLLNLGGGSGSTANFGVNTNGGANDANLDVNLIDQDANTATLDLGNTLGNGGSTAVVDLGGTGTNGNLVDLFGGNEPTTASVDLGGSGGTDGNVLLDLFGNSGNGSKADVALGNTGFGGAGNDAALDLFGPDGSNSDGGAGGTNGTGQDLFGPGGGSTSVNGGAIPVRVAAVTNPGKCFAPNSSQIEKLASRHVYGDATFSTWAGSSNLKIVNIGLCSGAGAAISANANVDRLQSFVATNAALKTSLGRAGHSPDDVIAADKNGATLTLYVM